jgi:predicted regulator of Ras-like GTPase activity (Roadblock/LC7/MglB family)
LDPGGIFFYGGVYGIFPPMSHGNFVLREPEYEALLSVLRKLLVDASAKVVFLVDKDGTLLASAGDAVGFDTTSLASLAAGNIAATGGLANLIGEKEFSILFHEGERDNMHLSVVAERLILVVVFDRRSSVGLVRLRVRQASARFYDVMAAALAASDAEDGGIEELTEADIESLFK